MWEGEERIVERNDGRVKDLQCKYEGCDKVDKSKERLVQHLKRKYRAPLEKAKLEVWFGMPDGGSAFE